MNRRIKILAAACIFASIALMLIQYQYLKNTYSLYQKTTLQEIKTELLLMEKNFNLDSTRADWMKNIALKIPLATENELRTDIRESADSALIAKTRTYIKSNNLLSDHAVKYRLDLSEASINFYNNNRTDLIETNIPWFYNENDSNSTQALTNYTLSSTIKGNNNEPVFCEIKTVSFFSVNNWFGPLLSKMTLNILASTFILLFAITLFYVSIKNLIKQNKIADMKTDFVNTITHEFNTPLAALNIGLTALKTKTENTNDELTKTAISTIERQYKRLTTLVNHTTEHSQGGEQIKLNLETVTDQQFLTDAITDFQHTHPEINICFKIAKEPIKLLIDSFHFTTAINNLMENAAKYGNGSIDIKTNADNDVYKISIEDNGPGIPLEKKKFIFEKFSRLETGNIRHTSGLGLGLYYAKNIISAHNGTIDFKNKEGRGTIFSISIPRG